MTERSLKLFALTDEVTDLERELSRVDPVDKLPLLTALAWQWRQRDSAKTRRYMADAALLFDQSDLSGIELLRCQARLQLTVAELLMLDAELDDSEIETKLALSKFHSIHDAIGQSDSHWLLATISQDRGLYDNLYHHLSVALQCALQGHDLLRRAQIMARRMAYEAFSNPAATGVQLSVSFPDPLELNDAARSWFLGARACVAALTGDPGAAITQDLEAYQAALNSGQIRHVLTCAANIAEDFTTLSDLDSALTWAENALTLARKTKWPYSTGFCLLQVGEILRQLERFEDAEGFLLEALQHMERLPRSRAYMNALNYLGLLALDLGQFERALGWFLNLEQHIETCANRDQQIIMARGQATALLRLGRRDEAVTKAALALELSNAQNSADEQIKSLMVLAELHSRCGHDLSQTDSGTALHYLDQAVKISKTVPGYKIAPELFKQIAAEYAASGEYRAAYHAGLAADDARQQSGLAEAQRRALAMQVSREIDRSRADTEQQLKLTSALQATNTTLETLGLIGRKITASLNAQEVLETLHHHADNLLDTFSFIVYLFNENQTRLKVVFGTETGLRQPFPLIEVPIDDQFSLAARCAREQREYVANSTLSATAHKIIPGTQKVVSLLFAPLVTGQRVLGVMSVQSPREHAYGERECAIFRTLCAYGAIALDNAAAYQAVKTAREQAMIHEQELNIAAIAFESHEGMVITDANQNILRANRAFTKLTGYQSEELNGRQPGMFKSARHSDEFYRAILSSVRDTETWQGEMWTQRKNGEEFPLWMTVTAVRTADKRISHYIYAILDITERKLAEDEIRNLAFYDALTKLPNRRLFTERLQHALATSARTNGHGALLFIDLDNFKTLNDTRGHDVGDLLLEMVGQRLSLCLRQGDTAARLGGDEFVVLLENLHDDTGNAADLSELVAQKIQCELNLPYLLKGKTHHISPSIGVTLFKSGNVTVDELLKHADLAMYRAKDAGRNTIRFFDPQMQKAVDDHAAMESDLRQAIGTQQFVLHYQIQTDHAGKVLGAEALIRWNHPTRGMVSPSEFIPVAEENGLILLIGEWILDAACRQLQAWSVSDDTAGLSLAVNVSARQFHDDHFVDSVMTALKRYNADPRKLKIELTESMLLKDISGVVGKMRLLIQNGVRFSLDDFGTGYSSLTYLKRLPIEQLKIDRSFIRDLFLDANVLAIVRAIVSMGLSMGLDIIAEGVETKAQQEFLQSCGCHLFQGYFYGRPVPAELLLYDTNCDETCMGAE